MLLGPVFALGQVVKKQGFLYMAALRHLQLHRIHMAGWRACWVFCRNSSPRLEPRLRSGNVPSKKRGRTERMEWASHSRVTRCCALIRSNAAQDGFGGIGQQLRAAIQRRIAKALNGA